MDSIPVGRLDEKTSRADTSELYNNVVSKFQLLTHPFSCLFQVLFKVIIVIMYYGFPSFMGFFTGVSPDLILTFCVTISLVLIDFLVVKNYTCVNMLGVSWYVEISDNGTYRFLKKRVKEEIFLNNIEVNYFWLTTYIWPIFWLINTLFRLTFFKFGPLVLSILVCVGGFVNLYNCTMCVENKRVFLQDSLDKFAKMIKLRK